MESNENKAKSVDDFKSVNEYRSVDIITTLPITITTVPVTYTSVSLG